jgi:hypothetical protein
MGLWSTIGAIAATGVVTMYGKDKVQKIVKYKMSAAKAELDTLVTEVVDGQNRALMAAVLDEFGNQFQASETREAQNEVNELLWYFKERFMDEARARQQLSS